MTAFEFTGPGRIIFGEQTSQQLGYEAAKLGKRALLISGGNPSRWSPIQRQLQQAGLSCGQFTVSAEPDLETLRRALAMALDQHIDLVVGLGGGSVLDTAKALALLCRNPGDPREYLEIVGNGRSFSQPGLPCIALPTTAGTGAEATRNAVISVPEAGIKASLRHPGLLPSLAIVDPVFSWYLAPDQTAWTGLDALTQLIEAWLCNTPNPFSDIYCRDGIMRCATALRAAWISATDHFQSHESSPERFTQAERDARSNCALAALESGLALANARLGAVHGLAGPLGGQLGAPHGAICAALLPAVLSLNLKSLRSQEPHGDALKRYDELARLLTGSPQAKADHAIEWVKQLTHEFQIPGLSAWGLSAADYHLIIPAALQAGSMKGNPVKLQEPELVAILDASR